MIVLDTNVVSEAMKPEPDPAVRAWLNEQSAETLYLSSVTLAELLFGIAALPNGKRKDMLSETLDGLVELFRGRILSFDVDAARKYAELAVTARTAGRDFPVPDGYIAAIAVSLLLPYHKAIKSPPEIWLRLRRPTWTSLTLLKPHWCGLPGTLIAYPTLLYPNMPSD